MKNTIKAILFAALVSQVQAATYTLANASGSSTTQSLVNSSGNFFTGSVTIGYYTGNDLSYLSTSTTTAALLVGFVPLGVSVVGPNATAAPGTIQGVFTVEANYVANGTTSGKVPFLLFGNGATFADSTEVAVIGFSGLPGLAGADPSVASNSIRNTNATFNLGTIYKGNWGTFTGDPTPGTAAPTTLPAFYSLVPLVAIPEPSAALLSMFGAVGLLRRKRN